MIKLIPGDEVGCVTYFAKSTPFLRRVAIVRMKAAIKETLYYKFIKQAKQREILFRKFEL